VVALLAGGAMRAVSSFILMEHIEGVEMGVGAYFDGANFLEPACLDWEHKRFFEGDLGELTGEMGTVVTYQHTQRFFRMTLSKIEPLLRKRGYCGYINLNTIVNKEGIWPLEFTCRFGYPGYAILDPLQRIRWGELFEKMINKAGRKFETADGFCVGIVVTTPPFPYSRHRLPQPTGLPILVDGELTAAQRRHLHYGEVGLKEGRLVTAGAYGSTLVVTGQGATIEQAREAANQLAAKVNVTNARYRRDIGQKLIDGNFAEIRALGLLE
jgi:phosphoribosylamine--glycine ligase